MFAGNFAPRGWAMCNGQLLAINQNQALFSLLGTTYGGDGIQTFALPDLQGRAPVHMGQLPGGSSYVEGQTGGAESVTLSTNQLPSHSHTATNPASLGETSIDYPSSGHVPARGNAYDTAPGNSQLAGPTIAAAGGGQPHENRSPYLVVNFIIALEGVFPSRN
jgi:microcystin-dependent protein